MVGYFGLRTKFVVHLEQMDKVKDVLIAKYKSGFKKGSVAPHEIELLKRVSEYLADWEKDDPIGDKLYDCRENPQISLLEWKLNKFKDGIKDFIEPGENFEELKSIFPEILDYCFLKQKKIEEEKLRLKKVKEKVKGGANE